MTKHTTRSFCRHASWYACLMLSLLGLAGASCTGDCPTATEADLPTLLGPALTEVLADGTLSCEEHFNRNVFNVCPETCPCTESSAAGITWTPDLVFGLFPNPFHLPLSCYRGRSAETGLSGYQCCYAGSTLVTAGPKAGTFDYVHPYANPIILLLHVWFDVNPTALCR